MSEQRSTAGWLITQWHFWVWLVETVAGSSLTSGVVSAPRAVQWVLFVKLIFSSVSYWGGTFSSPPRRPWSPEERARRGLPPI
jgi:hypothetical protein